MTGATTWPGSRIALSRPKSRSGRGESLQLGGTTLWGDGDFDLGDAVDALEREAVRCADTLLLTFTRPVLRKLVAEALGQTALDSRVFGAVLGRAQQRGLVDEMIVASKNDKPFRAYFGTKNGASVRTHLEVARELLMTRGELQVRDLESHLFGARRYNTWSSASHFLARLTYLGTALQLDDMTFVFVDVTRLRDA